MKRTFTFTMVDLLGPLFGAVSVLVVYALIGEWELGLGAFGGAVVTAVTLATAPARFDRRGL